MDSGYLKIIVPLVGTLMVAIGGWLFTYWHAEKARRHALENEARKRALSSEIEHVNNQIQELYGPMYAHLLAGRAAWKAFWHEYSPKHDQRAYFADGCELTEEELVRWRIWMIYVFHPHNEAMKHLILKNIHLIEGDLFPESFELLLAHVNFYDGIIAQWQDDFFIDKLEIPKDYVSVIDFPAGKLESYVFETYGGLIHKRRKLIETI